MSYEELKKQRSQSKIALIAVAIATLPLTQIAPGDPTSANPASAPPAKNTENAATIESLTDLLTKSIVLMNHQEWEAALELFTNFLNRYDRRDRIDIQVRIGIVWYRRGYCELKLERYAEAMKSFETCYRDFPNPKGYVFGGSNYCHKRSLLKWADAALGAKDYAKASRLYKKFLKERDPKRDRFPEVELYSNLSVCCSKLGKLDEAAKYLEIARIKQKASEGQ